MILQETLIFYKHSGQSRPQFMSIIERCMLSKIHYLIENFLVDSVDLAAPRSP